MNRESNLQNHLVSAGCPLSSPFYVFAAEGIPKIVISDNGPQYLRSLRSLLKSGDLLISPRHPNIQLEMGKLNELFKQLGIF